MAVGLIILGAVLAILGGVVTRLIEDRRAAQAAALALLGDVEIARANGQRFTEMNRTGVAEWDSSGVAFTRAAPRWAVKQVVDLRVRALAEAPTGHEVGQMTPPAIQRAKDSCEWVARRRWPWWPFGVTPRTGEHWQPGPDGRLL